MQTSSCRTFESRFCKISTADHTDFACSLHRECNSWRIKAFTSLSPSLCLPLARSVVLLSLRLLSLEFLEFGVQDKRQWTALFYAAERGKQEQNESGRAE